MPTSPVIIAALRFVAFVAGLAGVVAGLAWTYVAAQFRQCGDLGCTVNGAWPGSLLMATLALTAFIAAALALNFALRGRFEER